MLYFSCNLTLVQSTPVIVTPDVVLYLSCNLTLVQSTPVIVTPDVLRKSELPKIHRQIVEYYCSSAVFVQKLFPRQFLIRYSPLAKNTVIMYKTICARLTD